VPEVLLKSHILRVTIGLLSNKNHYQWHSGGDVRAMFQPFQSFLLYLSGQKAKLQARFNPVRTGAFIKSSQDGEKF
jgi:hypothetical protein